MGGYWADCLSRDPGVCQLIDAPDVNTHSHRNANTRTRLASGTDGDRQLDIFQQKHYESLYCIYNLRVCACVCVCLYSATLLGTPQYLINGPEPMNPLVIVRC